MTALALRVPNKLPTDCIHTRFCTLTRHQTVKLLHISLFYPRSSDRQSQAYIYLFIRLQFNLKTSSLNVIKMYIMCSIDMKILTIFIINLYHRIYLASENQFSIPLKKKKKVGLKVKKSVFTLS